MVDVSYSDCHNVNPLPLENTEKAPHFLIDIRGRGLGGVTTSAVILGGDL